MLMKNMYVQFHLVVCVNYKEWWEVTTQCVQYFHAHIYIADEEFVVLLTRGSLVFPAIHTYFKVELMKVQTDEQMWC